MVEVRAEERKGWNKKEQRLGRDGVREENRISYEYRSGKRRGGSKNTE